MEHLGQSVEQEYRSQVCTLCYICKSNKLAKMEHSRDKGSFRKMKLRPEDFYEYNFLPKGHKIPQRFGDKKIG